ncbi:hypothetical protein GCM10009719_25950 [Nocardioides kribbensis]|uniref:hypothetical protein n=1 Tax=Nocardioides kribbensis TaxID=305517 RepID=UPI0031CE53F7
MNESEATQAMKAGSTALRIGPPPTRQIVQQGVRRRRRRNAAVGAIAAVVLSSGSAALATSTLDDSNSTPVASGEESSSATPSSPPGTADPSAAPQSDLSRSDLTQYLADLPGVPLALPVDLPAEYRWVGPSTYEKGEGDEVTVRSSTFTGSSNRAEMPSVEVCVHDPDGHSCPQGAERIERHVEGTAITISFSQAPTVDQREFWTDATMSFDMTTNWLR